MKNMQHLVMNFSECRKLTDVSSIGKGIKEMTMMQHLDMNFCQLACQGSWPAEWPGG